MPPITATEVDLLACFCVEPSLLDDDVPWCYNESLYRTEVDGLEILFTVLPAYRDVRLSVVRDGRRLYELNARNVHDVRVPDEPGRDVLVILLTLHERLHLQLRPAFEMSQFFESND